MRLHYTAGLVLAALALATASPSYAQLVYYEWQPTDAQDWNTEANWVGPEGSFVPDAGTFPGESARVNTGGSAVVSSAVTSVNELEVFNGSVDIETGGSLSAIADGVVGGTGSVFTNAGGTLNLSGNGQLTLAGNISNSGMVNVSDTSQLTVGGDLTGGLVNVNGPGATISVAGNYVGNGTLSANITDASNHSVISVGLNATPSGSLNVDFTGVTPSAGDIWDLIDATAVIGSYGAVSTSTALPEGLGLFFQTQAGGTNGVLGQVAADVQLVLSINRLTGTSSILNRTASDNLNIDGYLITSGADLLVPGGWTSFADSDSNWTESNPGTNSIGELNLSSSSSIAADSSTSLGDIYSFTPTEFGEEGPAPTFEYHVPGGFTRTGLVEFEGPANNLVLLVDPATGQAAIQNQSLFNVDIDGYLITSESGSLDPSGFSGLGAGWTTSNAAANHIGDLNLEGSEAFLGSSQPVLIGTAFDFDAAGVEQDLEFEFHLAGGETMTGVVQYGEIVIVPSNLPGDFNNDGSVDAADYTVWRDNLGQNDAVLNGNGTGVGTVIGADYQIWVANYGATSSSSASTAVPEPASLLALLSGVGMLSICKKR